MKVIFFIMLIMLFSPVVWGQNTMSKEAQKESDEIDKQLDDLIQEFDSDKTPSCTNESQKSKNARENIKSQCGLPVNSECRTNPPSPAHINKGGIDFSVAGLTDEQAKEYAKNCSKNGIFCQYEKINGDGTQTNYLYQDGAFIREETGKIGTKAPSGNPFNATGPNDHCQQPKGADSRFDFGNVSKGNNNTGNIKDSQWKY